MLVVKARDPGPVVHFAEQLDFFGDLARVRLPSPQVRDVEDRQGRTVVVEGRLRLVAEITEDVAQVQILRDVVLGDVRQAPHMALVGCPNARSRLARSEHLLVRQRALQIRIESADHARRRQRVEPEAFGKLNELGLGRNGRKLGAGAAICVVQIAEHEIVLESGERPCRDADAEGVVGQVVDGGVERRVLREAFAPRDVAGHADRQLVADDGQIEGALRFPHPEITRGRVDIAAELIGRLFRLEEDGAARGVAPEQRALRPPQDLDVVHVVIVAGSAGAEGHFVEVILHAWVGTAERLALTADGEHVVVARAEIAGDRQRRRKLLQVERRSDGTLAQRLRRDCRDRDRNAFEIFRPSSGRDDDGLDGHGRDGLIGVRRSVGRCGRCRRGLRARRRTQHRRAQDT